MNQDSNNFNLQDSNSISNSQQQDLNNDKIPNNFNNIKPNQPKKFNIGLIIGIVALVIIIVGVILLFTNTTNKNFKQKLSDSSNKVDLTIDESISKSITCNLTGEAYYANNSTYSYEYILPNWNRYTFLKKYEPEYMNEPGKIYVIDYDKDCKKDNSTAKTNDFGIYISYYVDKYSSVTWKNIKERATDNLIYTYAGKPTLYGNDNGYWYAYMNKGYNLKTNKDDLDELNISIWKEMNKLENAHTVNGKAIGDEFHALIITIKLSYENETGKARLNYLLNDLKEILTEKYNLDLSKLTVDMIKK